mmetsp:Transcript_8377/g.12602  ORF Transcript_8377/g.12602 Transcript_8377/m.12602 type:complete len:81 (+) Transcript_8377:75-317(+)
MKIAITTAAALLTASTATAFVPVANTFVPRTPTTQVFAEGEKSDLVLDTNFDEVNIVKLLGLKRVKKMIRKNKKKSQAEN